ncbi:MAG: hypothetical protein EA383_12600 [Spirochaetaceae bacterium]|nr:MAG: hypothetical protein EA383_12600 [Spirochaetaceae bacterium]
MKRRAALVLLVSAGFLLNALLNTYRWLASGYAITAIVPSPVLLAGILLVWITTRTQGDATGRRSRVLVNALSACIGFALVYSVAEGAIQLLYARRFIPSSDISYVRGGLLLLFPEATATVTALTPFVIFLILGFTFLLARVYLLLVRATALQIPALTTRMQRLAVICACFVMIAVVSVRVFSSPTRDSETWSHMLIPIMLRGAVDIDRFELADPVINDDEREHADEELEADRNDRDEAYGLPGIRDADIYMFAVESYGITVFENEEQRAALLPVIRDSYERLQSAGFSVASHYLESPVFSGLSWLAEATLFSGNVIDRQSRFENLIETGVYSLPDFLAEEAQYYNMKAKPGAVHGDWPEGYDVFGFDEMLIAYNDDFRYRGPWFSFVPVPDQFAIQALHERIQERKDDGTLEDRPLFAYYQLVSSHIPFNHIPEYLSDWSRLGDGSIYFETDNQVFDNDYFSGTEYVEGFIASIEYVFEVLTEYVTRFIPEDRESLIVFFGDHQPGSVVSGRGASRSVPIHVISRNDAIVRGFIEELSYVPGMIPDQPHPHPHMADFYPDFVRISRLQPSSDVQD